MYVFQLQHLPPELILPSLRMVAIVVTTQHRNEFGEYR